MAKRAAMKAMNRTWCQLSKRIEKVLNVAGLPFCNKDNSQKRGAITMKRSTGRLLNCSKRRRERTI